MQQQQMNQRVIESYRRSLKSWMGYVQADHWASLYNVSAVEALGWLTTENSPHLEEFLSRYRKNERDKRRVQVRLVVLQWLAEFAL